MSRDLQKARYKEIRADVGQGQLELPSRCTGKDRHFDPGVDRSGIQSLFQGHEADPGPLVTGEDGPFHRGGPRQRGRREKCKLTIGTASSTSAGINCPKATTTPSSTPASTTSPTRADRIRARARTASPVWV